MGKHNLLNQYLAIALIIGQLLGAPLAFSADEKADEKGGVTGALETFNSGVATVGTTLGQVSQKVGETQMMAQQFANMGSFMQGLNQYGQQKSTFEQVRAQLAQTLTQGSQCLQSKIGKEKEGDTETKFSVSDLLNAAPTCENADAIKKAAMANTLKIDHAAKRLICLQNMQNQMEAGAKNITQPFTQLTTAATENIAQRKQIIEQYKKIGEKIDNDLNGRDGYRAHLSELKSMRKSLIDALSRGGSKRSAVVGDENMSTSIGKRIDDLKKRRNLVANAWHKQLMNHTMQCFQNTSVDCGDGSSPASALECVRRSASRSAANSPTQRAFNDANKEEINRALKELNTMLIRRDKSAKLDANNIDEFKKFTKDRFSDITDRTANVFEKRNFKGGVAKDAIVNFVKYHLSQCYNDALQEFDASMKSETNELYSQLKAEEKDIATDINKWLQTASDKMNSFRTKFTKIFSAELPQFANNCQAGDDPYKGQECLQNLQKALNDGIDGTNNEGITTMNVPTVITDAQGKISQSQRNFQCKGFEECLNMLDQVKDFNKGQADTQKNEMDNFVKNHNTTIDSSIGGISAQVSAAFGQMSDTISKFNTELAGLGITAGVTTKAVEGENLEKGENGIYKQPKNMLAALAGKGGISKMDKIEDTQKAIGQQRDKVMAAGSKATQMAGSCKIEPRDYAAVKNSVGTCTTAKAICGNFELITKSMEKLVQKSQKKLADKDRLATLDNLKDCLRDSKNDLRDLSIEEEDEATTGEMSAAECEQKLTDLPQGEDRAKRRQECIALKRTESAQKLERRKRDAREGNRRCLVTSALGLKDLNSSARNKTEKESYMSVHSDLLDAYNDIASSCPATDKEERDAVVAACNKLRNGSLELGGFKTKDADDDDEEKPVKDPTPKTGRSAG